MNKDVIYIDVEDDITAIIGKVKEASEKIVALVPPKRVGVLQSAVNLRLLQRAADQSSKRIVLITSNQALVALSAAAKIPVAKNLQSKPELAEIPVLDIDNGEDVIDGASLPVGDHAKAASKSAGDDDDDETEVIEGINIEDDAPKPAVPVRTKKPASKGKIPNFNKFRKRITIGIISAVVLVGLLVWAFVFAPAATVIITARTSSVSVNGIVQLGETTSAESGSLKVSTQSTEKDAQVEFEATGKKDVGEKATGTVKLSTNSISSLGTIPAGTQLTSGGLVFTTNTAVTLTLGNASGTNVAVTAAASGENYNGASGSLSGAGAGVNASFVGSTSGGTTKMITIVTADDVQKAKEKLVAEPTDAMQKELNAKFGSSVKVMSTSFVADRADATSAPAIGEEATTGKATLTSKTTYRLSGIETSELEAYITEALKKQMPDQTTQKVYSTGADTVQLNDFADQDGKMSVRLVATGQTGPVIDEDDIKNRVAGKKFGDIQSELSAIEGVSDVNVKFSFFWVNTVPKNLDKVTIEFDVTNANS